MLKLALIISSVSRTLSANDGCDLHKAGRKWQTIRSPSPMSNTFHCEIHIKTDIKDHKVEVELKNAYLTQSNECNRQSITVYTGKMGESKKDKLCGKVSSFTVYSDSSEKFADWQQVAIKIITNLPSEEVMAPDMGYEIRYRSVCCNGMDNLREELMNPEDDIKFDAKRRTTHGVLPEPVFPKAPLVILKAAIPSLDEYAKHSQTQDRYGRGVSFEDLRMGGRRNHPVLDVEKQIKQDNQVKIVGTDQWNQVNEADLDVRKRNFYRNNLDASEQEKYEFEQSMIQTVESANKYQSMVDNQQMVNIPGLRLHGGNFGNMRNVQQTNVQPAQPIQPYNNFSPQTPVTNRNSMNFHQPLQYTPNKQNGASPPVTNKKSMNFHQPVQNTPNKPNAASQEETEQAHAKKIEKYYKPTTSRKNQIKGMALLKKSLKGEKRQMLVPLLDAVIKNRKTMGTTRNGAKVHLKTALQAQDSPKLRKTSSRALKPQPNISMFEQPGSLVSSSQQLTIYNETDFETLDNREPRSENDKISQYILIGVIVCCCAFLLTMLAVVWRLYCSSGSDRRLKEAKTDEEFTAAQIFAIKQAAEL